MSLTWSLVVSTLNREEVLPVCVEQALNQTRPPHQVIVVDASDHWRATRDRLIGSLAARFPKARWVYEPASERSLALQRNQGLRHATSDVVFLIDDDSLMYPDCAAEIMRVYEADVEGKIAGVEAEAVDESPVGRASLGDRKATGSATENPESKGLLGRIKHWAWRNIFLMDAGKLFVPYEGRYPKRDLPETVRHLDIWPIELFQGYRMTYRREVIQKVGFEPLMRYYCAGEDLDASYRASLHGALVIANRAKLHHYQSAGGRAGRFKVAVLSATNQAVCLRKNTSRLTRFKNIYYRLMCRRFLAEAMKDLLSRRWKLPQARGILVAGRHAPAIFRMPERRLSDWYVKFQHQLMRSS
jgi:GT2 family glycosyltransferase